MSLLPLALVVVAAFIHATWNLLAKRAAAAGPAFVIAANVITCVAYLPWVGWVLAHGTHVWSLPVAACIVLSGILHLGYSLCLQRGYQVADLSVVYPIARGTGPLLSSIGAFILLHETPSPRAYSDCSRSLPGSVSFHAGRPLRVSQATRPGRRALGHCHGFADRGLHRGRRLRRQDARHSPRGARLVRQSVPFLHAGADRVVQPGARDGADERPLVARVGVGLLAPMSYILVLSAIEMGAPLSLVAPAREMSMMVGAMFGMLILRERVNGWRLIGCATLIIGVVLLSTS